MVAPFSAIAPEGPRNATVGLLTTATPDGAVLAAVKKGLGELGYIEGRNVTFMARAADGKYERLPALAAELVAANVSVILVFGGPVPARAAKAATSTIPIVFAYGGDPVLDGLVASVNRPGGNAHGHATFIGMSITAKEASRMLRELLPHMATVALPMEIADRPWRNRRSRMPKLPRRCVGPRPSHRERQQHRRDRRRHSRRSIRQRSTRSWSAPTRPWASCSGSKSALSPRAPKSRRSIRPGSMSTTAAS